MGELIANHLRPLVGNVLGENCQEIHGIKHFEVAVDLGIGSGAVNHGVAGVFQRDLGRGERIGKEGVEGKEEGGAALGQLECGAQQLGDGLLGNGAEAFEETAMAVEDRAQEFRQSQDDMTVGNRKEDVIDPMGGGPKNLALMAGGTEPPPFAGEGVQVFVRAVVAADAGKSPFQSAALEEFLEDLRNDGAKGTKF